MTTLAGHLRGITADDKDIVVGIAYTLGDLTATMCFDIIGDKIWIDVTRNDLEDGMDTPTLKITQSEIHTTFVLPLPGYAATVDRDLLEEFLRLTYEQTPKDSEFAIDQSEFDELLGGTNGQAQGPTL